MLPSVPEARSQKVPFDALLANTKPKRVNIFPNMQRRTRTPSMSAFRQSISPVSSRMECPSASQAEARCPCQLFPGHRSRNDRWTRNIARRATH